MKRILKEEAVALRQKGYLYSEIAKKLCISRSTAQVWTCDAMLSKRQTNLLADNKAAQHKAKMTNLIARKQALILERDSKLSAKAQSIVSCLEATPEAGAISCAIMYWCEGTKDVSAGLKFTNADPLLVRKFLKLLRGSFSIDETKLRALVHLHEYHDEAAQLLYWSKTTGIPLSSFHKSYVKPHTGKNGQKGYPGCISVRYYDSSLGKLLKMIYSEYGQVL